MLNDRAITIANDSTLSELIGAASRRIVILAPALSSVVAKVVARKWKELGGQAVSVVVDVDPEVYRLGYGDFPALQMLESTAAELGTTLNRQSGIRVGLVIADDETLVYSPTPLLIETGPKKPETPNAIRLGPPPPAIERDLGQGPEGIRGQIIGLDKADRAKIERVDQELKENPPQKFDISRSVRVFNAALEFVDFELSGTFIDRKTVPIPKHLSGVADTQTRDQLRTSFRILPPEHRLSGEHLQKDRNLIAKKYLRTVTGYGTVVLRSRKTEFEAEVEQLRADVNTFAESVKTDLQSAMDKNRQNLVKAMLPLVRRTPPKDWVKSDGKKPDSETLRQFLDDDLRRAFGTAEQLIKHMQVKLVFKGVTHELLTDPKFRESAQKVIPELEKLYNEFDAAKAVDSSKAQ